MAKRPNNNDHKLYNQLDVAMSVNVCLSGRSRVFYGQTLSFDVVVSLNNRTYNSSLDCPRSPYFRSLENDFRNLVCHLLLRSFHLYSYSEVGLLALCLIVIYSVLCSARYMVGSYWLTVNVLLNNITFLSFLLFSMCQSLHLAVNECINCSFVHLYLLFYYSLDDIS